MESNEAGKRGLTTIKSSLDNIVSESGSNLRFENVLSLFQDFFDRGLDGASLLIREMNTGWETRLIKHIPEKKHRTIEFEIKDQGRRNGYFGLIREYCQDNKLNSQLYQSEEFIAEYRLRIDCGNKIELAKRLFLSISRDVLKLKDDAAFDIETSGISRWPEIIDTPGQVPASQEVGLKLTVARIRGTTGTGVSGLFAYGALRLLQIIGTIFIIVTLLFEQESWKKSIIENDYLMVEISSFGLFSFFIILVSFMAMFFPTYWRVPTGDRVKGMMPIPRTPMNMFRHFVGQPINLLTAIVLMLAIFSWISIA